MPKKNCFCHYFRSKNYSPVTAKKRKSLDISSSGCYWCLRTMSNIGPDEHFTAPEECTPDRECYRKPL